MVAFQLMKLLIPFGLLRGRQRMSRPPDQSRAFRPKVEALEDRTLLAVVVSPSTAVLTEGRTDALLLQVRLSEPPADNVRVQASIVSGDRNITLANPSLDFNSSNWDLYQWVRGSAKEETILSPSRSSGSNSKDENTISSIALAATAGKSSPKRTAWTGDWLRGTEVL